MGSGSSGRTVYIGVVVKCLLGRRWSYCQEGTGFASEVPLVYGIVVEAVTVRP